MDELLFTLCIIITLGLVFLIVAKRNTDKSKIPPLFQYIDFFSLLWSLKRLEIRVDPKWIKTLLKTIIYLRV